MANNDALIGANDNDEPISHNQTVGLNHNHNMGITQNHGLEISQTHDLVAGLSQINSGQGIDETEYEVVNTLEMEEKSESGLQDVHLHGSNGDLDIAEHNVLAVDESQELHQNMDSSIMQHQEMAVDGMNDLSDAFTITPEQVLQHRAVDVSPDFELHVGQEFADVEACRKALRETAIALHFEMQTIKSDRTRFTAKCAVEGCPWRIHAAKLPGVPTFSIRTINNNHICWGIGHLGHQQASVRWVASTVEERLKENPNCKPKEILEEIHRVHGIALSYKQAWRGKERIMSAMHGSFKEGYRLLPQYCEQIKRANPESIASVYVIPADHCFQRLFVSFQACIYGFLNACRPLIGLDKTHLKNRYLGSLLIANGFDGDGALFPLAFGVVDEENEDNWKWFISELRNLLEINTENMPRLTILSDRQKGIVDGVDVNFPTAFHGFCLRHLSESFINEFNSAVLVNLLRDAAHALTVIEFEAKILEINEISQEAAYWIRRVPSRQWATAYFEGTRFGHLTTSMDDSINAWISEASGLPIIEMMESIRRQLTTWFNERREMAAQWASILVPSAERRVAEAIERSRSYQVICVNEAEFEVISHEGTNIVNIKNRCCLCRGWQLYGLPCSHAVAALLSCRQNVHRFTESCFTVTAYRKTYSQTIHPIPDRTLWKELSEGDDANGGRTLEILINPPKSVPPGRPGKKRVRAEDRGQAKRVVHCSRCNQTGHFRTTCAALI